MKIAKASLYSGIVAIAMLVIVLFTKISTTNTFMLVIALLMSASLYLIRHQKDKGPK